MVSLNSRRSDPAAPGFRCTRRAPTLAFRAEPHAGIELCYVPRGWMTYQLGGETVRVAARQLAVFWAAMPHQLIAHSEGLTDYLVMRAPLAWLLSCRFPAPLMQTLLAGRMIVASSAGSGTLDERLFSNWELDADESDPEIALAMLLELKARMHRLAWADRLLRPASQLAAAEPTKTNLLVDFVARRCTSRVDLDAIARELSLSPQQVDALLNQAYGTNLTDFVTRHRVFHAQRLLVTSRAKVAAIAIASGFGSLSRFNSVFRQACGCSPRHFRQQNETSDAPCRPS